MPFHFKADRDPAPSMRIRTRLPKIMRIHAEMYPDLQYLSSSLPEMASPLTQKYEAAGSAPTSNGAAIEDNSEVSMAAGGGDTTSLPSFYRRPATANFYELRLFIFLPLYTCSTSS